MTDDSKPGRIDLRALGVGGGAANLDEIIRNAIAGSTRTRAVPAGDDLEDLRRYLRPALLAAGILIVIAVGAVRTTGYEARVGSPIMTIADWTDQHHLPSNGELLTAFQGYGK